MKETLVKELCLRFEGTQERESLDWAAVNVPVSQLESCCKALKEEYSFDMLMDVTAIDGGEERPRFTVVYHFLSRVRACYFRVACSCEDDTHPEVPSMTSLWPSADWHEREVYDMFGIKFKNHPDLKRILMWEGYPHFPLRKEFPLAGIEGDLPSAEIEQETHAKVIAAPMMGGPFCAPPSPYMSKAEPEGKDQSWTEVQPKPDVNE